MGWNTGSEVADQLWKEIRDLLPEEVRNTIAIKIYSIFSNRDADDWEFEEDSLEYIYYKINKPLEFKELLDECE